MVVDEDRDEEGELFYCVVLWSGRERDFNAPFEMVERAKELMRTICVCY